MSTESSEPGRAKTGKSGFAIGCTLNILVICSVLVTIPIANHYRDVNPFFLMAFFNQMEAFGVIALLVAVGDIMLNIRREDRRGTIYGVAGAILSMTPLPVGTLALRLTARILGWHID